MHILSLSLFWGEVGNSLIFQQYFVGLSFTWMAIICWYYMMMIIVLEHLCSVMLTSFKEYLLQFSQFDWMQRTSDVFRTDIFLYKITVQYWQYLINYFIIYVSLNLVRRLAFQQIRTFSMLIYKQ